MYLFLPTKPLALGSFPYNAHLARDDLFIACINYEVIEHNQCKKDKKASCDTEREFKVDDMHLSSSSEDCRIVQNCLRHIYICALDLTDAFVH